MDLVMRCEIVPITQRAARDWITQTHRHLSAPRGDLYRTSLTVDDTIMAVGMAGRPCRLLQDGRTAEILRIASIAAPRVNACTRLYSALVRAGTALGYRRHLTYTLIHEPGTSLRAANFEDDGLTRGGEWDRPSRRRKQAEEPGRKRRWIFPRRASGLWDNVKPGARE